MHMHLCVCVYIYIYIYVLYVYICGGLSLKNVQYEVCIRVLS